MKRECLYRELPRIGWARTPPPGQPPAAKQHQRAIDAARCGTTYSNEVPPISPEVPVVNVVMACLRGRGVAPACAVPAGQRPHLRATDAVAGPLGTTTRGHGCGPGSSGGPPLLLAWSGVPHRRATDAARRTSSRERPGSRLPCKDPGQAPQAPQAPQASQAPQAESPERRICPNRAAKIRPLRDVSRIVAQAERRR